MPAARPPRHLTMAELEAGLEHILGSPADAGRLEMIVARPATEQRVVQARGELDPEVGLVGDNWSTRAHSSLAEQVTLMSSRVIALLSQRAELWPLAGDQLYVDLDLSADNVPPGTRLAIGGALVELSDVPHTGCKKFRSRFGLDALKFVSSPAGKRLQLRGVNARVVQAGGIAVGDTVYKA